MIVPSLPSQHFKTYEIIAPLSTHYRKATCAEVKCGAYTNGWKTIVPSDSPQAQYIRTMSGRKFVEKRGESAGLTEFTFYAGQQCFGSDQHRVPLEREPIYVARGGDARGNPLRERRVHANASDWQEDFAGHLDKVKKQSGEA